MTAAIQTQQPMASAMPKAAPMADSNAQDGSSGSSSAGTSTITANDFLTLLVTEMKNQDPTATTDPNEYINQLVQVNSLQQLISINEVLTNSLEPSSTAPDSTQAASSNPAHQQPAAAVSQTSAVRAPNLPSPAVPGPATGTTPSPVQGNLGLPSSSNAAQRLAHALDGNGRAASAALR